MSQVAASSEVQVRFKQSEVFLYEDDLVCIRFDSFTLFADGFTSPDVSLRKNSSHLLNQLFLVRKPSNSDGRTDPVKFDQPVLFLHYLSNKYLSYEADFTTKSEIRLQAEINAHCEFLIKPIYKCQITKTKELRTNQEIMMSLADEKHSHENVAMVASKFELTTKEECLVHMKKNQFSNFVVSKVSHSEQPTDKTKLNLSSLKAARNSLKAGHSLAQTNKSINNLKIYQLRHVESGRVLFKGRSRFQQSVLRFSKHLNLDGSLLEVLPKSKSRQNREMTVSSSQDCQTENSLIQEQQLSFGEQFCVRFHNDHSYLSFDMVGNASLKEYPSDEGIFHVEDYHESNFLLDSEPIRIRHKHTGLYVSVAANSLLPVISDFKTDSVFVLEAVELELLRTTLYANEFNQIFARENQSQDQLSYQDKKVVKKTLKEMLKFIYHDISKADFLRIGDEADIGDSPRLKLKLKITHEQQELFAEVGLIKSIAETAMKVIVEIRAEGSQAGHSDQKDIVLEIMMVLTGICKDNCPNLRLLCEYLPTFYDSFGLIKGSIQFIHRLFQNNHQSLCILENTFHSRQSKSKKPMQERMRSMDVLLSIACRWQFELEDRHKLIVLLESLCCASENSSSSKVLLHEQIVLAGVRNGQLDKFLLAVSISRDTQLQIVLHEDVLDLKDLMDRPQKYEGQIKVFIAQVNLMATLCSGSSLKNIGFFRQLLSEHVIYSYLRGELPAAIRQLFMRVLTDVYLNQQIIVTPSPNIVITCFQLDHKKKHSAHHKNSLVYKMHDSSMLSDRLLSKSPQSAYGQQMQEVSGNKIRYLTDYKKLLQITSLIFETARASLLSKDTSQELYINLRSLHYLMRMDLIPKDELQQLRTVSAEYLLATYKASFDLPVYRRLLLEIIKIFAFCEEYYIANVVSNKFVMRLRLALPDILHRHGGNNSERVIQVYQSFVKEEMLEQQLTQFSFLPLVISESIKFADSELFYSSSQLCKQIEQREPNMLRCLRDKCIIESEWSFWLYESIIRIKNSLLAATEDYLKDQHSKEATRVQLTLVITETNSLFFEYPQTSPGDSRQVSSLTQKLLRQCDFLTTIIQLITNRQQELLSPQCNRLFRQVFRFLQLFIENCQDNFPAAYAQLQKVKSIYNYPNKGQIDVLLALLQLHTEQAMNDFIFDALVRSVESNEQPEPKVLIGLIRVISSSSAGNDLLAKVTAKMLANESFIKKLFKVSPGQLSSLRSMEVQFLYSSDRQSQNYHEYWSTYLMLLLRLVMMATELSSEGQTVRQQLKQNVSLKGLLSSIELCFATATGATVYEEVSQQLVRIELIDLLEKEYLSELEAVKQFEFFFSFLQKVIGKMPIKKELPLDKVFANTDENLEAGGSDSDKLYILRQIYKIKTKKPSLNANSLQLRKQANEVYWAITRYFPFLVRVGEKVLNSNEHVQANDSFKKEIQLTLDIVFKKYKEFVGQRLTYSEYVPYHREYLLAIRSSEELLGRRMDFSLKYSGENEDEEDNEEDVDEGDNFLRNAKIPNTTSSFLFAANPFEKALYQSLIILFHQLQLPTASYFRTSSNKSSLKSIVGLVESLIEKDPAHLRGRLELLVYFVKKMPYLYNWHFDSQLKIMKRLASDKHDANCKDLNAYLHLEILVHQNRRAHPHKAHHEQQDTHRTISSAFVDRLVRFVAEEVGLYSRKKFTEQLLIYAQSSALAYESGTSDRLSIETVLRWLQVKLSGVNGSYLAWLSPLLEGVCELFSTYMHFVASFDSRYVPAELQLKLSLCLQIFYSAVGCGHERMLLELLERQVWHEINGILALDDSLPRNLQQLGQTPLQLIKNLTRVQFSTNDCNRYVQNLLACYTSSLNIYGEDVIDGRLSDCRFPLVPAKSLYGSLKRKVILLVKEFRLLPVNVAGQLLSRLDGKVIAANISQVYATHKYLFGEWSVGSVHTDMEYPAGHEYHEVAQNGRLDNAIELSGILMGVQSSNGQHELEEFYKRKRLEQVHNKRIDSMLGMLVKFLVDLFMLVCGSCVDSYRRRRNRAKLVWDDREAVQFCVERLGRVEVLHGGRLVSWQFMVYPECVVRQAEKEELFRKINFISVQLKRESIVHSSDSFMLAYRNQRSFYARVNGLRVMGFLDRNVPVLKFLGYVIVVLANLLLLVNVGLSVEDLKIFLPEGPFEILSMILMAISSLVLLTFCAKQVPLIVARGRFELQNGSGYFAIDYKHGSTRRRNLIQLLLTATDFRVCYMLVYTAVVFLILLNKAFVSLLLMDTIAHIPALHIFLQSLWTSKLQIVLAVTAFTILQYFFSIFMFFNFKKQAQGYCDELGDCFGFMFVTTYKTISGFVGYLFQLQMDASAMDISFTITFFEIFEDVYVILTFQIFFSLVLAIVIDSFSVNGAENLQRRRSLDSSCIVCNLDRSLFSLLSNSNFKNHIAINHNIFNYFSYKYNVNMRPLDQRNAFERDIVFQTKNTDWLPNGVATEINHKQ